MAWRMGTGHRHGHVGCGIRAVAGGWRLMVGGRWSYDRASSSFASDPVPMAAPVPVPMLMAVAVPCSLSTGDCGCDCDGACDCECGCDCMGD